MHSEAIMPDAIPTRVCASDTSKDSGQEEESALVARFQSGDESAFETLFRRYQDRFYRLSLRFLNNASEAEDVVQEAFVDIYHGLPRFRRKASFTTWAYRIVTRKCYARRGRHLPSPQALVSLDALRDLPSLPSLPTLDTLVVQQAMQRLHDDARLLLLLKYYEQFSDEEIAQIMGYSVGQSKMRVHRAKNALKDVLMQTATLDAQGNDVTASGELEGMR